MMRPAESSPSTTTRPLARIPVGWLVALVFVALLAGALVLHFAREASSRQRGAPDARAQSSSDEVADLKQAIALLQRKSSALEHQSAALEHQSAALEANVASRTAEPEATQPANLPSDLEVHRAELQELDAALVTEQANPRDSRAAADSFSRELTAATAGQARITDVVCAVSLCKAVVHEDTSVRPEMDTNLLIDKTPFLKREAMFDYERDGVQKRTIIYAAREGQSLAAARGVVLPSNATKP